jgi:hypothetical protein
MTPFFNMSVSMSTDGWLVFGILAVLFLLWRFFAWRKNVRFRASLATKDGVSAAIRESTQSIIAIASQTVPKAVNDDLRKQVAAFEEERNRLEEARDWVKVAVILHGYQDPYWEKPRPVYAPVLLNLQTGELKAPPVEEQTITGNRDYYSQELHGALMTPLGSPRWQHVKDGPLGAILMLGTVYHYRSREKIPV